MNIDLGAATEVVIFVMSAVMAVFGWFLRQIWAAVDDLRKDATKLREDLPRTYVPVARLDLLFDKIDAKLDRMMDRIDMKQDKDR